MKVYLAEKPSQGRDIAKAIGCHQKKNGYLTDGNGTVMTWCIGHLVGPADPDKYDESYAKWHLEHLPIIPSIWKLQNNPNTEDQLKVVLSLMKEATEVVIATDADREGECIARLLLAKARYQGSIKRLWLSSLDEKSIKAALDNIKDGSETESLFYAGLARSRSDWLVGMNYTRACTLMFASGKGNVYSVGRVQTPTLRLIVERDSEISNFIAKDYFKVKGLFFKGSSLSFEANWVIPKSLQDDEEGRCLKKQSAQKVVDDCQGKNGLISSYKIENKSKPAPLPFALSDLQQKANEKYGYNAKQVLEIAQKLYETHKLITYPRSDCPYLPTSQQDDTKEILRVIKYLDPSMSALIESCNSNFKSRCWNDKKVSESSHHGIILTSNTITPLTSLTPDEWNIYDLVRRQYIAQFLGDYEYSETTVEVSCNNHLFSNKGVTPIKSGWKRTIVDSQKVLDKIPLLDKGDSVYCDQVELQIKQTTPPKPYTDSTLLSAMKNAGRKINNKEDKEVLNSVEGIGTEATRAGIIETLIARSYVSRKQKYLHATDKGKEVIKILPSQISDVAMTAHWERKFTLIEKNEYDFKQFLHDQARQITGMLETIKSNNKDYVKTIKNPCPKCKEELIRHKSKNGQGHWWGCSGFSDGCDYKANDVNGKPVEIKALPQSETPCPDCGSTLVLRQSKKAQKSKLTGKMVKRKFWSCKGYPDCQNTYQDKNGIPVFSNKL